VLGLLGRTWASPPPVLPAAVLAVAAQSPLPADYRKAVARASLVQSRHGEEIHVPIEAAQALQILKGDPVRIGSILVSADGRWWESENLQSGEGHVVVYRPGGRLRIDFSADSAKLEVPWPDTQLLWPGAVHFRGPFEIFGREWHASSWETNGERTWLHLAFSGALPIARIQPAADVCLRRSRPAFIDMAWAGLENALSAALQQKNDEPIEQMRRGDLIPLGRAVYGLANAVRRRGAAKRQAMETQLSAIRYLQAEVAPVYGRVPWRILPETVRGSLSKDGLDAGLRDLVRQVFEELPENFSDAPRPSPRPAAHSKAPSQAA